MSGGSEADSQGRDSKADYVGSSLSVELSDEYFNELILKCIATVKELQADNHFNAAEDFQRLVSACECVKKKLKVEQDHCSRTEDALKELLEQNEVFKKKSENDKETIDRQREEIEKAWRERDTAQTLEQTAQSKMRTMREKLDEFEKTAKKSGPADSDKPGISIAQQKEGMIRERDRLNAEVEDLNKVLQAQRYQNDAVEKKRVEFESKCKDLYRLLDETSSEAFKEKRHLDEVKVMLNEVTTERNGLSDQLKHYRLQCETLQTNNVQLNLKIGAAKAILLKTTTQYNVCNGKLNKLQSDFDNTSTECDKLKIENTQKMNLVKLKESEITRLSKENAQLAKCRDVMQRRIITIDAEKTELTKENLKFNNAITMLEKDVEINKKSLDKFKKLSDEVLRERDAVRKDLKRAESILDDQRDVIKLQEQHVQSLENEIKTHLITIQQLKKTLSNVEKERDRTLSESQTTTERINALKSELELKMRSIASLTGNLEESQVKITHLQQQFDTLTAERNALQKHNDILMEDVNAVRDELRISTGKQNKLKELIETKAAALNRANKQIDKIEKEKSVLRSDVQNLTVSMQHMRTEVEEKSHEINALLKSFNDAEKKSEKLSKQLEAIQKEKDLTGFELVKRNEDVGNLNEKLSIMQIALDRAEMQYINRLDDIRLLKIEISNLRSQRNLLTRGLANTVDMRHEVLQLNRDLTQERVKSRALEGEMSTPMNIHRWRKLSGKDPEKMDLIVKIQTLQKRILFQTEIAVKKESQVKESNKLFTTLKEAMHELAQSSRIKTKLCYTQKILMKKTRKIKALLAETTAKDIDIQTKNTNVQSLKRDLFEKKQSLMKEKREKFKLKIQLQTIRHQITSDNQFGNSMSMYPVIAYKTIGAGFRIPSIYGYGEE